MGNSTARLDYAYILRLMAAVPSGGPTCPMARSNCMVNVEAADGKLGIDGNYNLLPRCGAACGSLHKHSKKKILFYLNVFLMVKILDL